MNKTGQHKRNMWNAIRILSLVLLAGGMVHTASASTSVNVYGDSVSATGTVNGITYANKYPSLLVGSINTYDNTTNFATPGDTLQDNGFIANIYTNKTVKNDSIGLFGYNDMRYNGLNSTNNTIFNSTLFAAVFWLTTSDTAKRNYSNSSITYNGTWSNNTVYSRSAKTTKAIGANMSFSFVGTQVIIGSIKTYAAGENDTTKGFNVSVDGVNIGDYSSYNPFVSNLGVGIAPFIIPITGLSNTTHKVLIQYNGSGGASSSMWFDYWTNETSSTYNVYVGNTLRMLNYSASTPAFNNGNDTVVGVYNSMVSNITTILNSEGYTGVHLINASAVYNPATDIGADQIHPNQQGYYDIYNAFINVMTTPRIYRNIATNISSALFYNYSIPFNKTTDEALNITVSPSDYVVVNTTTWGTSGDYLKSLIASSNTPTNPTTFVLGDFPAYSYIQVNKYGALFDTIISNATGYISFSHSSYSDVGIEAFLVPTSIELITCPSVNRDINAAFTLIGVLLLVFAAGLLIQGIRTMQYPFLIAGIGLVIMGSIMIIVGYFVTVTVANGVGCLE